MGLQQKYVEDRKPYRKFIIFLKRLRFSQGRLSVYDILEVLIRELKLDSLTKRASYMAFNFTLSIFPTIIFLFTLIPYIPIPDLNSSILNFLQDFMPKEMYAAASSTIEDIVNIPRGGLLSVNFLFALVLSTNGLMSLMDAFDKKYKTFRQRSYLRKRIIATGLTFMLSFILIMSIGIIFFGTYLLDVLVFYEIVTEAFTYTLIVALKYIAIVLLFLLGTCSIYYYVPAINDKWPFFSVGAVVATLLIFLVSWLFSLYIRIFDTYNHFYGSIGALVGMMIWLDFISMILVLGFEINISIDSITKRFSKVNLE
ncbi:YihY/virulence factor BrkB family protein [Adhaeribacter swui]|uniref:YihY/virulence factor BrkB family protein n=1 Tax=Adhaeribacter swui TaxID=2086471 RepID=A0A7G7GAA1_9BACT|nr:YihY/virulence factor BrkB family protein [Adhaeribacter swui]QNF34085.1 YihY/virulence factor BrkB family protein [Adhaeribacter swui]